MLPNAHRVSRIQKTLRWFEGDIPLLNLRIRDLSPEGQQSARRFATALIDQTRAESLVQDVRAKIRLRPARCKVSRVWLVPPAGLLLAREFGRGECVKPGRYA